MAANPNPLRIHDLTWKFWEAFAAYEPKVRLGGIYAFKPGYHSSRDENAKNWPGNYSIRDPQDQLGPGEKAAAIDLTFPDAQAGDYRTIDLYSSRLLASGQDPNDPRGDYLKEFFGQADADTGVEGWDFRYVRPSTSDSSHLWHIHISISREHIANPETYRALLSILKGETVAQWRGQEDDVKFTIRESNGSIWLCDFMSRRAIRTEAEWKRILVWGASGKLGQISHLGDLPSTESIDWYGTRIDDAETIVLSPEQVAEIVAGVEAASKKGAAESVAAAPKPLTFDETVAAANKAEDS